jgi:hypothetical protein
MIDSRLEEIRLDEKRRRPMTPAQMVRFYGGIQEQRPHKKGRFLANLSQALMSVGRSFRIKQPHYSEKA